MPTGFEIIPGNPDSVAVRGDREITMLPGVTAFNLEQGTAVRDGKEISLSEALLPLLSSLLPIARPNPGS
ncbi:MAG TPA: hypothetical protein VJ455_03595 [Ignavibacteria bacterium]|nr:hypothetical protein [Ignavibacteria bacterium]HLD03751.1 hypothetical protein [Candidatus Dojkabacteria bacterium]